LARFTDMPFPPHCRRSETSRARCADAHSQRRAHMRTFTRRLLVGALCLAPASSLCAQTADLSGHWEGSIQAPGMEVAIEVDLARNSKGEVAGTFGQLAEHLTGLPLANVTVDGRAV